MKRVIYLIISVLLFIRTNEITAKDIQDESLADSVMSQVSQTTHRTYFPLLFDPGLTMRTGAENIITFQTAIAFSEDRLIGTRWFRESNGVNKIGGVSGRFAKYAIIDLPVDYFSIVLAHEYFGHGARYRELDMDDIHYGFDWPPPYGKGGGEATNYKSVFISTHEILSIWESGIEVQALINREIGMRWMATNEMNYREASQYFWSFQILFSYIQDTNEDLADGTNDNDPRAYTRIINAHAGYTDVHNLKMSVKDLKSKMMLNAANPFIIYSMYSIIKTYLWDGNSTTAVPALRFGNLSYLPALRAGLTPFGIQYHLDNYLRFKEMVALVDICYGDRTFFDSWGGVGVNIRNIYQTSNFTFDLNANIWKQAELQFGLNPTVSKGGGIGGAFSVRGYYDFRSSKIPLAVIMEVGYKTTGFLEGYNLDSSPILFIGLALRN
jgi:hypothetical protein